MLALVHPLHNPSPSPAPDNPIRPPSRPQNRSIPSSSSLTSTSSRSHSAGRSSISNLSHHQHQHQHQPHSVPPTASSSRLPTAAAAAAASSESPPSSYSTPPAPSPSPSPSPAPPPSTTPPPLDIHTYNATELLRLLASLLTQIASTNDKLSPATSPTSPHHHHQQSHLPPAGLIDDPAAPPIWRTLTTASRTSLSNPSSALTFHARNIPTISLEAYLLRILKYCPTTNEVFLSLLVYFDRMSKLCGESTGRTFVIDSYNVHRLVIAGVTVASKFFSDVFYTNSRYAKVGGLPQQELNQLELQFLLLNDFRLVISSEEMQRYAEQLIVFSEQNTASSPTSPHTNQPETTVASGPMQAMGAIDAYGGRVVDEKEKEVKEGGKTPNVRPVQRLGPYASTPAPLPVHTPTSSESDAASESDAGNDTETETEGGWTTDDEPTIRPGGGKGSGGESDCASIISVGTEDGDQEEEREVEIKDVEERERVDRTPEQRGRGGGDGDYAMASP